MEYANTLTAMIHAYIISTRAQNKARSFLNETVKMEPLDQKLRKDPTACVEFCVPCSKASFKQGNKLSAFPAFVAHWKFTTKAAIFRRVQTRHTRICIILILKPTSIGSHVGNKLRSRLIHRF